MMRRALSLFLALLLFLVSTHGTQVMQRPADYKLPPKNSSVVQLNPDPHTIHKRTTGHVQAAYFTNWYVYQKAHI
jgi:chitinase